MKQFKQIVPPDDYDRWIEPLTLHGFDAGSGVLSIVVPNVSYVKYIDGYVMNELLAPIIGKQFAGKVRSLDYHLTDKTMINEAKEAAADKNYIKSNSPKQEDNPRTAPGKHKLDSQLNFELTFDNFIEGDCNRLARAAGLSVAENPGNSAFNPVFLYGESGLGKTHIAQAIGIEVKRRYPDKNVLYVTTQKFIDQFTSATHRKEVSDFVRFYQMIDVLIVDDIQALSGRPGSQNALFNLFNDLHQNKKQLIFTSDKPTVELTALENRLISRFKWGLSIPMLAPDFETKVAIIKSKAMRYSVELSQDVIEYLAENITSNVRELEGAISSFAAHSSFLKIPATIDLAMKILSSFVVKSDKEITVSYIIDVVCDFYKVNKDDVMSKSRVKEITMPRHVIMYLAKECTDLSLKHIGAAIGGRTHATVVHSCEATKNMIDTNKDFEKQLNQLRKLLR